MLYIMLSRSSKTALLLHFHDISWVVLLTSCKSSCTHPKKPHVLGELGLIKNEVRDARSGTPRHAGEALRLSSDASHPKHLTPRGLRGVAGRDPSQNSPVKGNSGLPHSSVLSLSVTHLIPPRPAPPRLRTQHLRRGRRPSCTSHRQVLAPQAAPPRHAWNAIPPYSLRHVHSVVSVPTLWSRPPLGAAGHRGAVLLKGESLCR